MGVFNNNVASLGSSLVLTGASSQLAVCLIPQLVEQGYHVQAWSRQTPVIAPRTGVTWVRRDLTQPPAELGARIIVHLAPLWLLPALLQACPERGVRVVAMGSCSIKAKALSPSVKEREVAARLELAEQQLLQIAQRDGHQLTILRPTMLYGAGRDETIAPMQRFIQRWGCLPLPRMRFGLRQPVHVEDVAAAIVACLLSPSSVGGTYELGGAERLALDALAKRLFSDNARRVRLILIPRAVLAAVIRLRAMLTGGKQWDVALLERASLDQLADNEAAMRDFGYSPRAFDGRFPDVY